MRERKSVKVALVISGILLAMAIGGRTFLKSSEAVAAGKVQYKVVSGGPINTIQDYEKLLNQMADQGWVFDHVVEQPQWLVFRK